MTREQFQLESLERTLALYATRHSAPELTTPEFTIRQAQEKEKEAKKLLEAAGRGQPGRRYLVQASIDWGVIVSLLVRRQQLRARMERAREGEPA